MAEKKSKKESKSFGIAGMVLGILGLLLFLAPYIGIVFSILAIVFYALQKKREPTGPAMAGLVTGIIGTVLNAIMLLMVIGLLALFGTQIVNDDPSDVVNSLDDAPVVKDTVAANQPVYGMGDPVVVDNVAYIVYAGRQSNAIGNTILQKTTTGKLISLDIGVMNVGKKTQQIFTPRFTLKDGQGRVYDELADDMLYVDNPLMLGEQIQPDVVKRGTIVFEVPATSSNLELVISGDWLSTSQVEIQLDNITEGAAASGSATAKTDQCDVKDVDFIVYAEDSGYAVGLIDMTFEDKGTWGKLTKATVFVRSATGFDVSDQFSFKIGEQGDAESWRTASFDIPYSLSNSERCIKQDVDMSITFQNPQNPKKVYASIRDGVWGTNKVIGSADVDIREFAK
ncbi:MAG: DUF4352 domain-containing protein [Nanoarchaeota archaeon]